MKFAHLAIQSATLAASVSAQDAFLFTYDHGTVRQTPDLSLRITSDMASSIIARRRGLTDDRYLSTRSDADFLKVDFYGGYQQPLFDADHAKGPAKIMIRFSGYENHMLQFAESVALPDCWIEAPSRDLLDDFKARKETMDVCEYNLSIPSKKGIDIVYSHHSDGSSCMTTAELETLPLLTELYSSIPNVRDISTDMAEFLHKMNKLAATSNVESTVLVLPPSFALSTPRKRRFAQEELLDLLDSTGDAVSQDVGILQKSNSSHPLPKIVPQCFTSEAACNNVTNSCSEHGKCYRAHANCFKCKCGTTSTSSKLGKKTTQWGGNACQKKDVSIPFTMFATFGIVMTALVAGAIGMLYDMGAQDLPSVLGAGVGSKSSK